MAQPSAHSLGFPLHSPLPRRPGLSARAEAAAVAEEQFPLGRPALEAPRGHGPARALPLLRLSWARRRSRGLTGSVGFGHVSNRGPGPQPGPWEGSGEHGAASPGAGCGRPLAGAPRAHSPARGAGGGARSASGRCARLGPVALRSPALPERGRAASPSCTVPRGAPWPYAALGDRWTAAAGSLAALVSRPPAGQGAWSRAGSARNWPPVGDICIARPRPARPARPHPRGGTRPAAAPPSLHLSAGLGSGFPGGGRPTPPSPGVGEAELRPASPPPLGGRRPRPALALSLRGYTADIAPGVYPGTQLPGEKGEHAGGARSRCSPAHPLPRPSFPLVADRAPGAALESRGLRPEDLSGPLSRWRCSPWDGRTDGAVGTRAILPRCSAQLPVVTSTASPISGQQLPQTLALPQRSQMCCSLLYLQAIW